MRFVITSDLHLDWSTAGLPRFDDLAKAFGETVQAAIDRNADGFLFLGDLCDPDTVRSHLAIGHAAGVAEYLRSHNIPSRWLVGNHDVVEDGRNSSTLAALRGIALQNNHTSWRVFDQPTVEEWRRNKHPSVDLVALPYTARAGAYDPIAYVNSIESDADVVLFIGHLWLEGIGPGSETRDMPRGREVFWPLDAIRKKFGNRATCIGGHYHERQVYEGVHVVGSLERLTLQEIDHRPGFFVVEVAA